ncbi:MAG: 1-deoxy-D-xylulose-5-phosphate synthase [Oscillospiraceae bacterium]|nr:1-deoxy-D-xylulose-5-phosphate synthase [Oscillospiraceae bacterium]
MSLYEINDPQDLKKLNKEQLRKLPAEIREFLIENVSKTGGHLASNLGVVELTIALHLAFDLPTDKIVWDVGHQSYVHKILTGRRDKFQTLRKFGGISGFPKPAESEYDSFSTGHSSTSISAALGMAMAEKLSKQAANPHSGFEFNEGPGNVPVARRADPNDGRHIIGIIGDGALTGGMAFEALNHAGNADVPMIVVLNDNGMSISQNVGGVARYLNKIRKNPRYRNINADVKSLFTQIPLIGKPLQTLIHNVKMLLKKLLTDKSMFKNFGLQYLGPIDGHNTKKLIRVLRRAVRLNKPVLVHVLTTKGKGYKFAEENPDKFHGIGAFDAKTGEVFPAEQSFSDTFGDTLCTIAETNEKVAAITAAMPDGTGLAKFAKKFPDRFVDVGIAEQHMVTLAAGMASNGMVPVVAVYSTFLQRAYDQILHDVALSNQHVVFAIDRAGCVGKDGETHQGLYDLSYLLHIPDMTILAPASKEELAQMLDFAIDKMDSPVAIRYPRSDGREQSADSKEAPLEYGKGTLIRTGADILIISLGTMLQTALVTAEILQSRGISAAVINARFAKPLDVELIEKCAKDCKIIATLEDNTEIGGFGSYVEAQLKRNVQKFAFPDKFIEQGETLEILEKYELDAKSIAEKLVKQYEQ